jgi:hypothetical protein
METNVTRAHTEDPLRPRPGETPQEYRKRLDESIPGSGWVQNSMKNSLIEGYQNFLDDELLKPKLAEYEGIGTLADKGQLQARTLSGKEIQSQMAQSPWLKMAFERQEAEQSRLMDQAARQQAGALAGARSNLAMRGGLRGGAAERMATAGAENVANLMQQQRQGGAVERGQLGMQGADLASRLGQFNIGQQTGADVTNLQTRLADLANTERRKLFQYGEGMKGYAAEKTAQGYENSGSGGLFGNLFGGK